MSRLVVTGGRWHRYSLDGERVPGVTSITGKIGSKDSLVGAAAKETAVWAAVHAGELATSGDLRWIADAKRAYRDKWNRAAEDGRRVHSIAERLVYGQPVETFDPDTTEPYSDDVVRMGEQVARFMDRWDVQPDTALVERPCFNDQAMYAGTFDLLARLRGGETWLVDYKTGQSGVWPEHALQATAYSRATHVVAGEDDKPMPHVDRCAALWVRPDAWELIPLRSDDLAWHTFLAAIPIAKFAAMKSEEFVGAAMAVPARAS